MSSASLNAQLQAWEDLKADWSRVRNLYLDAHENSLSAFESRVGLDDPEYFTNISLKYKEPQAGLLALAARSEVVDELEMRSLQTKFDRLRGEMNDFKLPLELAEHEASKVEREYLVLENNLPRLQAIHPPQQRAGNLGSSSVPFQRVTPAFRPGSNQIIGIMNGHTNALLNRLNSNGHSDVVPDIANVAYRNIEQARVELLYRDRYLSAVIRDCIVRMDSMCKEKNEVMEKYEELKVTHADLLKAQALLKGYIMAQGERIKELERQD